MAFEAPHNYKPFYDYVISKCETYIELKYWDQIDYQTFYKWLSNFKTDEDKYLAALILNRLFYRNDETVYSMLNNLFHIKLPNILKKYTSVYSYNSLEDWEKALKNTKYSKDELAFLFSTITTGELGESGTEYIREVRKNFVSKDIIAAINSKKVTGLIKKEAIIFIDDFIGSGDQINGFITTYQKILRKFSNIIFMPLIAHRKGIKAVYDKANELNLKSFFIEPIEIISENDECFNYQIDENGLFDKKNTIQDLIEFYEVFVKSNHFSNEDDILGFDNSKLALIFSKGIPDNSIAILHKRINSWEPLYEKF